MAFYNNNTHASDTIMSAKQHCHRWHYHVTQVTLSPVTQSYHPSSNAACVTRTTVMSPKQQCHPSSIVTGDTIMSPKQQCHQWHYNVTGDTIVPPKQQCQWWHYHVTQAAMSPVTLSCHPNSNVTHLSGDIWDTSPVSRPSCPGSHHCRHREPSWGYTGSWSHSVSIPHDTDCSLQQ